MKLVRTTITIDENIYRTVKKYTDNFSAFVKEALLEYLKKTKIKKAKESFGSWHRTEKSTEIVKKMRAHERNYISSSY